MIDSTFWKGKKVFLTGHTGFKGSWLSIWLNQLGADVLGYALPPNTKPSLYEIAQIDTLINSVIGDIRDLDLLKQTMVSFNPDIVIHMAAQPLVRDSYENPVDTYAINVMGTVNVLESVRHCPSVKAVVNVTTDKVYENKEWVWGYRENDQLGGYDPYSNSKACSELVTSSYINSFFNPMNYAEHGVAIATARAGNVIGGGDWAKDRLVPDIIRAIENNEEIEIRNPHAVRPWQHVLEPLSGYLMLAEKLYLQGAEWNGAWNFGPASESMKTVKEMVNTLVEVLEKETSILYHMKNDFHETSNLMLDNSKSGNYLGYRSKWNLVETIKIISEWYKGYWSGNSIYEMCIHQINIYSGSNKL